MREFTAIGDFATYLGTQVMREVAKIEPALEAAAKIVEDEAKARVGIEHPTASGPFQAWPPLADATRADRVAHGFPENEPLLRYGILQAEISHVVHGYEATVGSDDWVALWQEVGTTTNIPERSFLGAAAYDKAEVVAQLLGGGVAMALAGGPEAVSIANIGALVE
jgi:hypothetical protein